MADRMMREPERSWRALRQIEKVLGDYDVAITYPLADAVLEVLVERDQLRDERQAVLDAINLYGDETLHKALDGIGWPQVLDGGDTQDIPRTTLYPTD